VIATRRSIPIWAIPPALLLETAFCALLAAAALDSLVHRPRQGGGSITTLLPGFTYATATVMKVCVAGVAASALLAFTLPLVSRSSKPSRPDWPVWGIASVALPPLTPLLGTLAVLGYQLLIVGPGVMSPAGFSQAARNAVFVMLAVIVAGALAAVASFLRSEQPRLIPILGFTANLVLIALFWHFRFYALGFDQDLWAPRGSCAGPGDTIFNFIS
jgi:hypothetical protein